MPLAASIGLSPLVGMDKAMLYIGGKTAQIGGNMGNHCGSKSMLL